MMQIDLSVYHILIVLVAKMMEWSSQDFFIRAILWR